MMIKLGERIIVQGWLRTLPWPKFLVTQMLMRNILQ